MEPVNRFALIVRPKRRYMEWANQLDDDGPRLTLDELPSLTEVYLLDATDSEADREDLIDEYAEEIWAQQLDQWSTDDTTWPANRTPHTLRDWFDMTFVDMVYDADPDLEWDEPVTDSEQAEAEMQVCQWCHRIGAPDDPVVTLSITLATDDPLRESRELLVPMMIAGALRVAIRAQADSEAARAGKDMLLACCSDRCAEAMREAIRRERAALLS